MVVWLFLAVSWVCLRLVIVVFPDRTQFSFQIRSNDLVFFLNLHERLSNMVLIICSFMMFGSNCCAIKRT